MLSGFSLTLVWLGVPLAAGGTRDAAYHIQGRNPLEESFTLYYGDAKTLLDEADTFHKLYIQYHSCLWTNQVKSSNEEGGNNNEDVEENDYWYRGSVPLATPVISFSLYGLHEGRWSRGGCRKGTFINTFLVSPSTLFGDNFEYEECNEDGQGIGCTASGGFAFQEYSLDWEGEPMCDADHSLSTLDTMDDFNNNLQSSYNCLELSDASVLYSWLSGATACSFEDSNCPDPFGMLKQYHRRASGGGVAGSKAMGLTLWSLSSLLLLGAVGILLSECVYSCKSEQRLTKSSSVGKGINKKSKRRQRRASSRSTPKQSRRRFWFWPRSQLCCDDSPTLVSSTLSEDLSEMSSRAAASFELPRITEETTARTSSPTPPADRQDRTVSRFIPIGSGKGHLEASVEVVANSELAPVISSHDDKPPGKHDKRRRKKPQWLRPMSPFSRRKRKQDIILVREPEVDEHVQRSTPEPEPAKFTVVGYASTTEPKMESPGLLSNTTAEQTLTDKSPSSPPEGKKPRSKIHVQMTEPGHDPPILETIDKPKRGEPKDGLIQRLMEQRGANRSPQSTKDPPGVLTRIPTADVQGENLRSSGINEESIGFENGELADEPPQRGFAGRFGSRANL